MEIVALQILPQYRDVEVYQIDLLMQQVFEIFLHYPYNVSGIDINKNITSIKNSRRVTEISKVGEVYIRMYPGPHIHMIFFNLFTYWEEVFRLIFFDPGNYISILLF